MAAKRGIGTLVRGSAESVFLSTADGPQLTYAEADDRIDRFAGWLVANGIGPGDRIAIQMANRPEVAIAMFAAARIGAIFVVLNEELRPHGLAKIFAQAEPRVFVADDSTRTEAVDAEVRVTCGAADGGWVRFDDALAHDPIDEVPDFSVDDPACLVFTSGSTGSPRGVTLSHENITFVVDAIQRRLGYRADDVVGGFLPLSFDYGLYQVFLAALAGANLFIGHPGMVGPRLPRVLDTAGVTVLPGVPTVYSALIALHARRPFELPSLRAITNTGQRLPGAHIERLGEMFPGLRVFVMYGLTECKRVSILLPEELADHGDSVGRPLDGTEVYAVDESGARRPAGVAGELVVTGPHVAYHGYWRAPDETRARYRQGPDGRRESIELFTGDMGFVDEDGFVHFAARADDLLKHRGHRISPIEIEEEASRIPGVVEACVVLDGANDRLHLVARRSDEELTGTAMLADLAEKLEPAKVPDDVHFVDELPRSMNGKTDRAALTTWITSEAP
ncbi:MAG: class I adenylate-forming enzyme family protein [Actinomycetota bacterium]